MELPYHIAVISGYFGAWNEPALLVIRGAHLRPGEALWPLVGSAGTDGQPCVQRSSPRHPRPPASSVVVLEGWPTPIWQVARHCSYVVNALLPGLKAL